MLAGQPARICFSIGLIFNSVYLFAEQSNDLYSMSLEELLSTKVSVASLKETSLRESPGIITVISADEIKNSGARDLIDLLMTVPGFNFGVDVQGQVGIGIRGNWANEGKVSLRLNGVELNEPLYSTIQLLNRFSLDDIKQIEIIRGPGSVIYGGFAELAVINIKTQDAKDINGLCASALYGQMQNDYAQRNINLMYGKAINDNLNFTSALFTGQANTSDKEFEDVNGSKFNLNGNNTQTPFELSAKINYKELKTDLFVEQYRTKQRDEYGIDMGEGLETDFYSYYVSMAMDHKLSGSLTLTPSIKYQRFDPWKEPYDPNGVYDKTDERVTGDLSLSYDMAQNANILAGFECLEDNATDNTDGSYWYNGSKTLSFTNYTGFVQGIFNTPFANITLGGRYDNHSKFGSYSTPRVGLTKIIDKLHFKLLYSKAYRTPSIENINLNNNIKPEDTAVTEFETGYIFNENMLFNINLFSIEIDNPIVYSADPITGVESYYNFNKVATNGAEAEYRIKSAWGCVNTNYSYYRVAQNTVSDYEVPGNNDVLLAFPAHKVTLSASYKKKLPFSVNPSLVYFSERYGYVGDGAGNTVLKQFGQTTLANIYFLFENIFAKNFDAGIGFYDIFKSNYAYIQPYNEGHPPLPVYSSEVAVKLSYKY